MLAPDVKRVLNLHLECIKRQHTPECNRDCVHCDALTRRSEVIEAIDTALKVVDFLERKRNEHERKTKGEG